MLRPKPYFWKCGRLPRTSWFPLVLSERRGDTGAHFCRPSKRTTLLTLLRRIGTSQHRQPESAARQHSHQVALPAFPLADSHSELPHLHLKRWCNPFFSPLYHTAQTGCCCSVCGNTFDSCWLNWYHCGCYLHSPTLLSRLHKKSPSVSLMKSKWLLCRVPPPPPFPDSPPSPSPVSPARCVTLSLLLSFFFFLNTAVTLTVIKSNPLRG